MRGLIKTTSGVQVFDARDKGAGLLLAEGAQRRVEPGDGCVDLRHALAMSDEPDVFHRGTVAFLRNGWRCIYWDEKEWYK